MSPIPIPFGVCHCAQHSTTLCCEQLRTAITIIPSRLCCWEIATFHALLLSWKTLNWKILNLKWLIVCCSYSTLHTVSIFAAFKKVGGLKMSKRIDESNIYLFQKSNGYRGKHRGTAAEHLWIVCYYCFPHNLIALHKSGLPIEASESLHLYSYSL